MNKFFVRFVTVLVLLSAAFAAAAKDKDAPPKLSREDTYALLEMFGKILDEAEKSYVEPIDKKKAIEAGINGMLTSLDPHSSFLNEKDFADIRTQTKGEFGGLGIEITSDQGWVRVISPIDDTPAFTAGIKPGDYITHVDGVSLLGLSLGEAVEKMRGKPGTSVTVTIRRKGVAAFDIKLKRAIIKMVPVKYEAKGDVGYIRISTFNESTTQKTKEAVQALQKKLGRNLKGFVIDLRNNPGGLLDQAVQASDLFLDRGEIVSTRGRDAEAIQRFNATKGDVSDNIPLVVIINDGSASASEIFAGAMQDHKRAVIVGTKSYGKASVQTVMPLSLKDGITPEYAIRLTTARYYTPSGHSIQAKGITPDVIIKPSKVEELPDAFSRSEAELYNALANEEEAEDDEAKAKRKARETADPFAEKDEKEQITDYQLDRAIDILRSIAVYTDDRKPAVVKEEPVKAKKPAKQAKTKKKKKE